MVKTFERNRKVVKNIERKRLGKPYRIIMVEKVMFVCEGVKIISWRISI